MRVLMKLLLYASALLSLNALADCRCVATQAGRTLLDQVTAEVSDCQRQIGDNLFQRFQAGSECQNSQNVEIIWGCGSSPSALQPKSFSCDELRSRQDAESTLTAAVAVEGLLNISWSLQPGVECSEVGEHDHAAHARELPPGSFLVAFQSDEEILEAINEMNLLNGQNPQEVLRLIREESPVSFELPNPTPPSSGGNELPGGGSIKISFKKERNGATSMMVDHQAGRRSNIEVTPRHQFNLSHIEAYFLEERVQKVVFQSANRNRAFFWRAEGGIHKIYGNNDGEGRPLIRTAEIMEFYNFQHSGERQRPQILYQGVVQGRPKGIFVGGEIGASVEQALSRNAAIMASVSAEARGTTLNDGSYGGVRGAVQGTYRLPNGTTARAGIEISARQFLNGENSVVYSARVGIGRENWDCEVRASVGDSSAVPDVMLPNRSGYAGRVSCGLKW